MGTLLLKNVWLDGAVTHVLIEGNRFKKIGAAAEMSDPTSAAPPPTCCSRGR